MKSALALAAAALAALWLWRNLESGLKTFAPRAHAPVVVMQDHGSALKEWRKGIDNGKCPSTGQLAILHVDKHDDFELPALGYEVFERAGRKDD